MSDSRPFACRPADVRRIILQQARRANVGHIGSCLSIVEILCALYDRVLRIPSPDDPDRDRFVLSKGHAALALFAVLHLKGWLDHARLNSYCGDDSLLGVHPDASLDAVDFSTGSLGHGLAMAAGAALAARVSGSQRRAFCLLSDGECDEGSVWESAMFASHHALSNLTAIVDLDGQQALGYTRDVCNLDPLADRWAAFGWDTVVADGHSVDQLASVLAAPACRKPRAVIARTVFGKGVPFMEQGVSLSQPHIAPNPVNWHYLPMSDEEFRIASAALETA